MWVYWISGLALLDPKKGGWGGRHRAGSTTDSASGSIKLSVPSRGKAPDRTLLLEAMAAGHALELEKQAHAPPMRMQPQIKELEYCAAVRGAIWRRARARPASPQSPTHTEPNKRPTCL